MFKKFGPVSPGVPSSPPTKGVDASTQGQSPSQSSGSGRFTLWIAYKIAQAYYASEKYEMVGTLIICRVCISSLSPTIAVNAIVLLTNGISFALQAVILLTIGAWADYGQWRCVDLIRSATSSQNFMFTDRTSRYSSHYLLLVYRLHG